MKPTQRLQLFAWGLSLGVSLIAIVAWSQGLHWQFSRLSALSLFPLLGLLAFSLMWTHYITSVMRQVYKIDKSVLADYFDATSLLVLVAILLHPGLLYLGLFKQGFGLPPQSYLNHYIAAGTAWATVLGTLSLIVFLAYELRRKFEKASWWKYVASASDMAMLAIAVHSFTLGGLLQRGWLRGVWIFYTVTLLIALGYIYYKKFRPDNAA